MTEKPIPPEVFTQRKQQFLALCDELCEQFYKKNVSYNDSFFRTKQSHKNPLDKKINKIDFYIQIRRKTSRLAAFNDKKLMGKKFSIIDDEGEEDTIKDLGIYCIMELMLRRMKGGKKWKPLAN